MNKRVTKTIALVLSILLLAMQMAACGNTGGASTAAPGTAAPSAAAPSAAAPEVAQETEQPYYNLTIGTAAATGTYYPIGAAISELATRLDPNLFLTAQVTGGSVENIKLVSAGDADIGFANQMHFILASKGEGSFNTPIDNIRSLVVLDGPEYVMAHALQIVVPADSDIKSVRDLVGKKVSVGAAGSGCEQYMSQMLQSAGISYDDFDVSYLSYEEQESAMADGLIDAGSYYSAAPTGAVESMAATNKVRLLDIDEDIIQKCAEDWGFKKRTLSADTYSFMDKENVTIVADYHCIFVNQDMDEDLAYRLTKLILDNVEELWASNGAMDKVTAEGLTSGWSRPYLHPGAIRYFEEKGIEIPEGAYPPEYKKS